MNKHQTNLRSPDAEVNVRTRSGFSGHGKCDHGTLPGNKGVEFSSAVTDTTGQRSRLGFRARFARADLEWTGDLSISRGSGAVPDCSVWRLCDPPFNFGTQPVSGRPTAPQTRRTRPLKQGNGKTSRIREDGQSWKHWRQLPQVNTWTSSSANNSQFTPESAWQ